MSSLWSPHDVCTPPPREISVFSAATVGWAMHVARICEVMSAHAGVIVCNPVYARSWPLLIHSQSAISCDTCFLLIDRPNYCIPFSFYHWSLSFKKSLQISLHRTCYIKVLYITISSRPKNPTSSLYERIDRAWINLCYNFSARRWYDEEFTDFRGCYVFGIQLLC